MMKDGALTMPCLAPHFAQKPILVNFLSVLANDTRPPTRNFAFLIVVMRRWKGGARSENWMEVGIVPITAALNALKMRKWDSMLVRVTGALNPIVSNCK
jgi:hypothetical protein